MNWSLLEMNETINRSRGTAKRLKIFRLLPVVVLLAICTGLVTTSTLASSPASQAQPQTGSSDNPTPQANPNGSSTNVQIYLPHVRRQNPGFMMLGAYIPGYAGSQQVINTEIRGMDSWIGKQHSIVGLWVDLKDGNPAYNIPTQLESLYKNGYTAFINLKANHTMAEIAQGNIDTYIRNTARAFSTWANKGENRMAFIAPFTEMNGDWTTYGSDPTNFKLGYQRVRNIFTHEGVPASATRWVFGPNGWSIIPFEDFYPGDAVVDINALSSYNYGYCSAISPWFEWKSPQVVYGPYLQRMKVMAPSKPIFIAQTATTGLNKNGMDPAAKNQWLEEALNYLAADGYVQAFIYVNLLLECDWPIYTSSGVRFDGYKQGATNSGIIYLAPADMVNRHFVIQP